MPEYFTDARKLNFRILKTLVNKKFLSNTHSRAIPALWTLYIWLLLMHLSQTINQMKNNYQYEFMVYFYNNMYFHKMQSTYNKVNIVIKTIINILWLGLFALIYMVGNSYVNHVRINNKCASFLRIYTRMSYINSNK